MAPPPVAATGPAKKIRFTWNQTALCTSAVPVAVEAGIFGKHNLDAELVNSGGSADQLLEAICSGKADVDIGMILRWPKPLEHVSISNWFPAYTVVALIWCDRAKRASPTLPGYAARLSA